MTKMENIGEIPETIKVQKLNVAYMLHHVEKKKMLSLYKQRLIAFVSHFNNFICKYLAYETDGN